MKNSKTHILWITMLLTSLLATAAHAQITPSGDSYTNTADATTNHGAKTLLDVDGATQITYIQFNLASIPSTASISQRQHGCGGGNPVRLWRRTFRKCGQRA